MGERIGKIKKNRVGEKHGDFIVIAPAGRAKDGHAKWLCKCDCGNEIVVAGNNLLTSKMQCQQCHNRYLLNLQEQEQEVKGKRFAKLTVIRFAYKQDSHRYYECICDCGNVVYTQLRFLKEGKKTSCGCDRPKRIVSCASSIKGKYPTTRKKKAVKLYRIYHDMHRRCEKPNRKCYKNYGGRGISVCEEWSGEDGYDNFCEWAYANGFDEHAPYGKCTLDRIDNSGNYEPSNCRWANEYTQANNRRNNHEVSITGKKTSLMEACREIGIPYRLVQSRLQRGWDEEIAFINVKGISKAQATLMVEEGHWNEQTKKNEAKKQGAMA